MMVLISRGFTAKLPNKFLFRNKIQNRGLMARLGLRLGLSRGSAWLGLVGSGPSDPDPTNLVTPYRFTFKI